MTDPDTPNSLTDDTRSGQEPATAGYGDAGGAAPDPHAVKTPGDDAPAAKDNSAWVTGDEPMTGPQASYLETLAHQAGETPPTGLTKAQASDEIERLQGSVTPDGGSGDAGSGDGPDLSRQERPTTEWVTGDEPMTGPQASYLETLAQQAGEEPPTGLTKSQASRAIDELRQRASSTQARS
ncbi:DUF3072 domain-containing protein [Actinomycetospora lutea]|uniref:DUF3072 domain-containing protein n=1 Tax=Actinomycetospora lutea TaxID=663604 RepID=UPI003B68210D